MGPRDRGRGPQGHDIVSLLVGLPPLGMALAARAATARRGRVRRGPRDRRARTCHVAALACGLDVHGLSSSTSAMSTPPRTWRAKRTSWAPSGWSPGTVSAGIDLVTCRLRRGDVGGAEQLLEQAARTAAEISGRKPGVSGFHDFCGRFVSPGRARSWRRRAASRGGRTPVRRGADARGQRAPEVRGGGARHARPLQRPARPPSPRPSRILDRALGIARESRDPRAISARRGPALRSRRER